MPSDSQIKIKQKLLDPRLPLAIYAEIAAHLSQVQGVKVTLLPQSNGQFDYYLSQIEGLEIEYPPDLTPESRDLLEKIIQYYCDRHRDLHYST